MCLGIPGQICAVWESADSQLRMGKVDFGGIARDICLAFTPEAQVGDYVMVHVGFAISQVDESAAQETLALLQQMDELAELTIPPVAAGPTPDTPT